MASMIPVRTRDGYPAAALVDDADLHRLSRFRWTLVPSGYVARKQRHRGGRRVFYLHREVVGATHGDMSRVEHINRDRLDNRRENLLVKSTVSCPPPVRPPAPVEEPWRPETATERSATSHVRARSGARR